MVRLGPPFETKCSWDLIGSFLGFLQGPSSSIKAPIRPCIQHERPIGYLSPKPPWPQASWPQPRSPAPGSNPQGPGKAPDSQAPGPSLQVPGPRPKPPGTKPQASRPKAPSPRPQGTKPQAPCRIHAHLKKDSGHLKKCWGNRLFFSEGETKKMQRPGSRPFLGGDARILG